MPFREDTYLDRFVQAVVDVEDESTQDKINQYGSQLLRSAAFFMPGRVGLAATVGLSAFGQAKPTDSIGEQLADAGLGATKGALLRGTMHGASAWGLKPVETGVALGVTSRILETGLNRSTYISDDGKVDFGGGLKRTLSTSVDPTSLAFDVATFGLASAIHAPLNRAGLYEGIRAPLYANIATGATMGFSVGAFNEYNNAKLAGKDFDIGAILREGAISSVVDGVAAAPGGAMRMRASTPYIMERGKLSFDQDSAQSKTWELETHQLVAGKVTTPLGGSVDVIVHGLKNPEAPVMHRYPLNRLTQHLNERINFGNGYPEVSTREIMVNGVRTPVWIQRTAGIDLENALPMMAKARYGTGEPSDVVKLINETPQLKQQLGTAFYERLLYGELDNWHTQYLMPGAEAAAKQLAANPAQAAKSADFRVQSIDADFSFMPHQIPSWSMKASWGLMDNLHKEFAGKPLPPEAVTKTEAFLSRFDTPKGHAELRSRGLSEPELSGLMSRAHWFVQNKTYPVSHGPIAMFAYGDENSAATSYASTRMKGEPITQQMTDELIAANRELSQKPD